MLNLNAADRCDRCNAQAYHVARKGRAGLLLCNHHEKKHRDGLLEQGWEILSDKSPADPTPVAAYTE